MGDYCYSIVRKPKGFETSNEVSLKRRIEGNDLRKCQAAIEELLQSVLDGEKFPTNLMMPVINRYQMSKFGSGEDMILDKRIKKLLYILWECLPKRGPDGKFLDRLVMVCGAFDKDLKHPNQYVCGSVLRTLGKTREPEVIRELVHSIEKCLEWSYSYQRKNAVLAIAKIFKNFPDLNPTAPKLIYEYLLRENDDECKRAALQAMIEIDPHEAKPYLQSINIQDIHCVNASIQLSFVELVKNIYKKGTEEAQYQIKILTTLIKLSSSPSVRYQAATTLIKLTRDKEAIQLVTSCFIDICAKESDNNVKLIALNSLVDLRRLTGTERVLRNSIMDILFILQSTTDFELQEKILTLSLDLLSPLNVGGVAITLKQELEKHANDPDKVKYRLLLVDSVQKVAERFPNAIVEFEVIDTLFDLLISNTIGDRLIFLLKLFMSDNPKYKGKIVDKIQDAFNQARDCPNVHRGLIQLLGDFSETKGQIEKSYRILRESLGELPIVETEMRKNESASDEASATNGDVDLVAERMKRLVTADGSYASQAAVNYNPSKSIANDQPLRSYFLKNNFQTSSVVCYAVVKMACRYRHSGASEVEVDKMLASFLLILASIYNLGHSSLTDADGNTIQIDSDHAESLVLGQKILQNFLTDVKSEASMLMEKIVTQDVRSHLSLQVKQLAKASNLDKKVTKKAKKFDDAFPISILSAHDDDLEIDDKISDSDESNAIAMPQVPDMFREMPLTGTIDPIYAYFIFDVNTYDIDVRVYMESRAPTTLENVTLELVAKGGDSSTFVDRPDPIVLAPRAKTCIKTSIRITSSEDRRLFGSITFDGPRGREQVIMLNDQIHIKIIDNLLPSTCSFEKFRDIWRDCEWENKVVVKTKHTNLKDYLAHLITATNMCCVTSERGLDGDCSFLSANLCARTAHGDEALVNVSIEKVDPQAVVTGEVKIRSRSQGLALSLGEKINKTQDSTSASNLK